MGGGDDEDSAMIREAFAELNLDESSFKQLFMQTVKHMKSFREDMKQKDQRIESLEIAMRERENN